MPPFIADHHFHGWTVAKGGQAPIVLIRASPRFADTDSSSTRGPSQSSANGLRELALSGASDARIGQAFLKATLPPEILGDLRDFIAQVDEPLAVRSSSLLEDSQYQPFAGVYATYMLANNHPDLKTRLKQLIDAIKLVYASTYFQGPKAFSRRIGQRTEEEKMAVIVQQVVGTQFGDYYYPHLSGIAQSHNYYPLANLSNEDGIASIVVGLGKAVIEGGKHFRFCPRYPGKRARSISNRRGSGSSGRHSS